MQLTAIIEIPAGSLHKYELNKKTNRLKLDRPLNQPIPYSYGFFESTLCEDGDPIDLFVLTDTPIPSLTEVDVKIIGVLKCLDNGKRDDKLISILEKDCQGYEHMGIAIVERYLETYKQGFVILGFGDREEAIQIYKQSVEMFKSQTLSEN